MAIDKLVISRISFFLRTQSDAGPSQARLVNDGRHWLSCVSRAWLVTARLNFLPAFASANT